MAEQMWKVEYRKPFDQFYKEVKSKYKLLEVLGIAYGPEITIETLENYSWD